MQRFQLAQAAVADTTPEDAAAPPSRQSQGTPSTMPSTPEPSGADLNDEVGTTTEGRNVEAAEETDSMPTSDEDDILSKLYFGWVALVRMRWPAWPHWQFCAITVVVMAQTLGVNMYPIYIGLVGRAKATALVDINAGVMCV